MARISQAIKNVEEDLIPFSESEPWVNILVYGQNGKGKTRFGASGPDVILLDINERGTQSVREIDGRVYHARRWERITWFYWFLKFGRHRYRTVVIDNLSTMQNLCMRQVLRDAEIRDPNKDPKMAEMRHWGKVKELMGPMILDFRNLDMHVVFLAQEKFEDRTGQHVPDMSPGPRGIALGSVGIIGRLYKREFRVVNRRTRREMKTWKTLMLVAPHDDFVTKDRTYRLGNIVVEPTMPKIITAWEER